MHAIRKKAHRAAWKADEVGQYNPFGKTLYRPTSKTRDLEQGRGDPLRREQSEANIAFTSETNRANTDEFRSPVHSSTAPADAPSPTDNRFSLFRRDDDGPYPNPAHVDTGEGSQNPSRATTSNATGTTLFSSKNPSRSTTGKDSSTTHLTANGSTRQRKITHMFGIREKDEENSEELEKSESKASKPQYKFTLWGQLRATIFGSWINILLVCVPAGIALHFAEVNPIAIFVVNFLAIIPLAGLLSYATEEIAIRVGETLGGLLNASFGNAVELIVSILALVQDEIVIVKTSLIGSMLSNLLLVLGMCFFAGGIKREQQFFNEVVAQTAASLLALAVGSLIIPTVFRDWSSPSDTLEERRTRRENTTPLSRGVAVILLVIYGCYLLFQLKTHTRMYNEPSQKVPKRKSSKVNEGAVSRAAGMMGVKVAGGGGAAGDPANDHIQDSVPEEEEEDEEEVPQLSLIGAIITLCVSTAFVGWTAEYMVDSIGALTRIGGISAEFVGLILIPIVGNAAEHATAVTVAIKDKMDLAIGVAVGSSLQIALLLLPLTVVIGWILQKDTMNLSFDGFLVAILFVAVLLVNYLIADGRSHWMEGALLMSLYIIIAVAAWYYPASVEVVG